MPNNKMIVFILKRLFMFKQTCSVLTGESKILTIFLHKQKARKENKLKKFLMECNKQKLSHAQFTS